MRIGNFIIFERINNELIYTGEGPIKFVVERNWLGKFKIVSSNKYDHPKRIRKFVEEVADEYDLESKETEFVTCVYPSVEEPLYSILIHRSNAGTTF